MRNQRWQNQRWQQFAHVYENGADFRNMSQGATIDKSTMPHGYMDAPLAVGGGHFHEIALATDLVVGPNPPPEWDSRY